VEISLSSILYYQPTSICLTQLVEAISGGLAMGNKYLRTVKIKYCAATDVLKEVGWPKGSHQKMFSTMQKGPGHIRQTILGGNSRLLVGNDQGFPWLVGVHR
jgi:hypothetical protein